MPNVSADAVLLRYMPADSDFIRLDESGIIETFETGWLTRKHFENAGASFYVKAMLAEKYPEAAEVASIVETCGSAFSALSKVARGLPKKWRAYCVAAMPAATVHKAGLQVTSVPTDIPVVGFAHVVVTYPSNMSSLDDAEFDDKREVLLRDFQHAYTGSPSD